MKNGKSLLIPFIIMVVLFIGVMIFFAVSGSNDSAQPSDQSVVNALYVNSSDVKTVTVTSSDPDFPQVSCKSMSFYQYTCLLQQH